MNSDGMTDRTGRQAQRQADRQTDRGRDRGTSDDLLYFGQDT